MFNTRTAMGITTLGILFLAVPEYASGGGQDKCGPVQKGFVESFRVAGKSFDNISGRIEFRGTDGSTGTAPIPSWEVAASSIRIADAIFYQVCNPSVRIWKRYIR